MWNSSPNSFGKNDLFFYTSLNPSVVISLHKFRSICLHFTQLLNLLHSLCSKIFFRNMNPFRSNGGNLGNCLFNYKPKCTSTVIFFMTQLFNLLHSLCFTIFLEIWTRLDLTEGMYPIVCLIISQNILPP